ncbi:hypothetical protein CR513_02813, partial [Mucuna pruriens]
IGHITFTKHGDNIENVLWESFDYLGDTFRTNLVIDPQRSLSLFWKNVKDHIMLMTFLINWLIQREQVRVAEEGHGMALFSMEFREKE